MLVLTPAELGYVAFDKPLPCSVFLAGPCPRTTEQHDWRDDAVELFRKLEFSGTLIVPTDLEGYSAMRNTRWECSAIWAATVIMFWIPRTPESPGLCTNVEFGVCAHDRKRRARMCVGWPEENEKDNEYLRAWLKLTGRDFDVCPSLESLVKATIELEESLRDEKAGKRA